MLNALSNEVREVSGMARIFLFVLVTLTPVRAWAEMTDGEGAAIPESGDARIFEIMAEEEQASELVYSSTKTAQSVSETPAIVTVISRADIVSRGYRTIGEALASVPGLYVIDDFLTANVAVRGIYGGTDSWSRIIKVMIDGQPLTFYGTGGNLLGPEFIPLDAVEAIEVIRGPGSALYGANAFLGVINVITRRSDRTTLRLIGEGGMTTSARYPSGGGQLTGQVVGDGEKPSSILLSVGGGYFDRSGLGVPRSSPAAGQFLGQRSSGDTTRPLSVLGRAIYEGGAFGTLQLMVVHQHLDSAWEFSNVGVLSHRSRVQLSNTVARLEYRRAFLGERLQLRLYGSYTLGVSLPDQRFDIGAAAFLLRRDSRNDAGAAGLELSWRGENYSLLAGVDFLHDVDRGDATYQVFNTTMGGQSAGDAELRGQVARLRYTNVGPYVQAIYNPHRRVGLTAGVRYDVLTIGGNAASARGGVVYQPIDRLYLKLLYGGSVLPPAPTELGAIPLRIGGIEGNPKLENQRAHTLEIQGRYKLNDHLSAQLNGFVTFISKRIEAIDVGVNQRPSNLTSSTTAGSEAVLTFSYGPFFSELNGSFQWTLIGSPAIPPPYWRILYDPRAPGGILPPGSPMLWGNLIAGVSLPKYFLQLTVTGHFAGIRKGSLSNIRYNGGAYTLPGYFSLDAHIRTMDLKLFGDRVTEFSLHGTNLLNSKAPEGGALGVDIPAQAPTIFFRVTQEL